MIVGPHTSNHDFIIGLAFRSVLRLTHVKFLGKKELFKPPFGFIFRWLGGTPVDRAGKHQLVEQVSALFQQKERFAVALAPEGTRKKVDRLRTGFYYIARKSGVPLIMIGLDYNSKQLIISPPFYTGEDEEEDMAQIIRFFGFLKGKNPEQGLSHLLKSN